MRSNFYKWKSRFTIQESEENGERKTGDVGREGRWMKGKLLWFIVWYEDMESQSGDLQPQLYDMSLKHQSKHFLVKSILSHEWKPLAIDDLRWIKYSASSHFLVKTHTLIRSTQAVRSPEKVIAMGKENVLLAHGWFSCLFDSSNIIHINYSSYHKRELRQIASMGFHWGNCQE